MKIKKIIAALLVSVCVFSFFSCVEETTSSEWIKYTLGKDKRTYSVSGCVYCASLEEECCCDCHYGADELCEECSYDCIVADRYMYIDRYQKWPVDSVAMNACSSCPHIHTISMSDYVTSIAKTAFSGCKNLETVIFGNSVSSVAQGAFKNCTSLSTLILNDEYTSVKTESFMNCTSLTSVDLTYVTEIEMNAFKGCDSLKYVILGNGVTKIAQDAFEYNDDEPVEFFFLGSPEEWEAKCQAYDPTDKNKKTFINGDVAGTITPFIYYYSPYEPEVSDDPTSDIRYWSYYDGVPTPW